MGKKGFTLVELIVVVTILAILSTIGFIAYSSYLLGARDSNRIASLSSLSDGFELYKSKFKLPLPDNNIEVHADGKLIGWQGYIGKNVLETLKYTKGGFDPLDGSYFSYMLTSNKKNYQFMAYLEKKEGLEGNSSQGFIPQSHADAFTEVIDYEVRYPKLYGKGLGIMTNTQKVPLQEVGTYIEQGYVDIMTVTDILFAYIDDQNKFKGDHTVLSNLSPFGTCLRLRDYFGTKVSGFYKINPSGVAGAGFDVYCEMQLGGGGWTLIATTADDGQSTWTYNNRILLSNAASVGTIGEYKKDYKSQAYSQVLFKDMMFLDKQGIWGAYDDMKTVRDQTVSQFMPQNLSCAYQGTGRAYYMTSGSVSKASETKQTQHDRTLFFSVYDNGELLDNTICNSQNYITHNANQHAIGPTWGYRNNNNSVGKVPDDPGLMGWGPHTGKINLASIHTREGGNARIGIKGHEFDETNDGDYILWFVR